MDITRSNQTLLFAILDTIFIAVSILLFLLGSPLDPGFWVNCVGFAVAFIAQVTLYVMLNGPVQKRTDLFFHVPLYYIGGVYFVVTALLALALLFLPSPGFTILLALQIVLLATFLVLIFSGLLGRNLAQAATERVEAKNELLKEMSVQLQTIAGSASAQRDVQKKISALAEEASYGRPMTHAGLDDVERQIRQSVASLKSCVLAADWPSAEKEIVETRQLFVTRDNLCKSLR
ncbi:MAG: hypothetical protein LBM75_02830 [Myxococcales bacterium]|jgi:hypothetical protein|nr:hypothetical protein [Myxococcales bacterium]